jgi:hypothetical protein
VVSAPRLRAVLSGHGCAGSCPECPRGQQRPADHRAHRIRSARYGMHVLPPPGQTTKERGGEVPNTRRRSTRRELTHVESTLDRCVA